MPAALPFSQTHTDWDCVVIFLQCSKILGINAIWNVEKIVKTVTFIGFSNVINLLAKSKSPTHILHTE